MQTVSAAWTAEEKDLVQKIVQNLQVSWKKDTTLNNSTFTIGTSTIGGSDIIGINPGAVGNPGIYKYFDESAYVKDLSWESGFTIPIGGLSMAMAEATLANKDDRFTPHYMGGNSELFTSILPRRPVVINAGFNYGGIDNLIPQFSGLINKNPIINMRNRQIQLSMADYVDFFGGRKLDKTAMFTGVTTDILIEDLFIKLGMSTAQYDLDPGINVLPYAILEKDATFSEKLNKLVQAENGRLYQDEQGKFRFENRQHWDSSPYNQVQKVITTSQVINTETITDDHIVNLVEVKGIQRAKQQLQPLIHYTTPETIPPGEMKELFFSYEDPILEIITPTAGGQDSFFEYTGGAISVKSIDNFAQASKIVFQNSSLTDSGTITRIFISGRTAKQIGEIYYRGQRDASITAYEEHPITIENEFITDPVWAASLAEMILEDFSDIDNIQKITVRAIPELQKGDLISWQGKIFRLYDIKTKLDPSSGFIQELTMLQKAAINSYFRIGISNIAGTDKIAP